MDPAPSLFFYFLGVNLDDPEGTEFLDGFVDGTMLGDLGWLVSEQPRRLNVGSLDLGHIERSLGQVLGWDVVELGFCFGNELGFDL